MKVTIATQFRDKENLQRIYFVGELVEFDNDRAEALASRGLVRLPIADNAEIPSVVESTPTPVVESPVPVADEATLETVVEETPTVAEEEVVEVKGKRKRKTAK